MSQNLDENLENSPKDIRILRLLLFIEGVNRSLSNSREMESELLLRQYEYLKKQYTKQLLDLLAEYQLPILMAEAA